MALQLTGRESGPLSLERLELVAEAVMLRLDDRDAEMLRIARMRELLWAASELTRALSIHTQHALVDCCGTHGIGDLAADTRALHSALERYAGLVRTVADDYSPVLRPNGFRVRADNAAVHERKAEAV